MIEGRDVSIGVDENKNRVVYIQDIRFKGKRNINWDEVKEYIRGYVGDFYHIDETADIVYIGSVLPDEYTGSESRIALKGANAKAKAKLLVNHASNRNKYLYDILEIKKETSSPQQ